MNRISKQHDDHDNRVDNTGDDSRDTKVSSSKDGKTKQGGCQSRHLIPEVPPGFQSQLANQRHQRDPEAIYPGMKFTCVIDGVLPTLRGYFITIRLGNGLNLQGQAFFSFGILTQVVAGVNVSVPWVCPTNVDHIQENHNLNKKNIHIHNVDHIQENHNLNKKNIHIHNTGNQESFIGLDINEIPPEFKVDDELLLDSSDVENQRHHRDPGVIYHGMEFTGVVDGVLPTPGGYFITIRVGNALRLQGQAFFSSDILTQVEAGVNVSVPWVCPTNVDHTQENHILNRKNIHSHNTGNQEPFIGLDINEIPPEFKVDDELLLDSSDVEMPHSLEIHMSDPLPTIGKIVPVVLKPTNPSTQVPIDQTKYLDKGKFIPKNHYTAAPKGNKICIDPFSPRNCQPPTIGMTPLYDIVGTTTFLTEIPHTEQCARFTQPGAGSPSLNQNTIQRVLSNITKKVDQHQLAHLDPVAVMHPILEKNHQERVMRQQCMHVNTKIFISQSCYKV